MKNLCFCIVLLHQISCATYSEQISEVRSLYVQGQYDAALKVLEQSVIKEQKNNRLLYLLEKAMIEDRKQDLAASRRDFFAADRLADQLYTVSLSKEALTFLYNDMAQSYAGEDYEKVAIHSQLALSFIEEKNLKSAVVEARKINTKLIEINNKYDDKKNRYAEDAFARYLAAAIHQTQGHIDDAIIDYRHALRIYEGVYRDEFAVPVPDQVIQSLYELLVLRGRSQQARQLCKNYRELCQKIQQIMETQPRKAQLLVIFETGVIARKTTAEFIYPIGKQLIRFSFPVIKPRHGYWGEHYLQINNKRYDAELLQNFDQIAAKTLEDKRLRLMAKQAARLLAKGQLTEEAYKRFGVVGGLAANIYSAVTETADTRSWNLLPRGYWSSRVWLEPGTHIIEIKAGTRQLIQKKLQFEPGELKILRIK